MTEPERETHQFWEDTLAKREGRKPGKVTDVIHGCAVVLVDEIPPIASSPNHLYNIQRSRG